jgi:hypothetical protein
MVSTRQTPARSLSGNHAIPSLFPLIGWIDRELTDTYCIARGRGGDTLLKLRRIFSGKSLNSAIGDFYRLLPKLERNHFLLSYRIRRWISVNFEVQMSDPLERVPPERLEIRQSDLMLGGYRESFADLEGWRVALGDARIQIVERSR